MTEPDPRMAGHLVRHALAVVKHADAAAVASRAGLDAARTRQLLAAAVASGQVVQAQGKYLLTPLARMALDGEYSRYDCDLRKDTAFIAAADDFERVNIELKALITDWQTLTVAGAAIANDHSDRAHDARCIDRLGALHERAEQILGRLAAIQPRLAIYPELLEAALERAEDGAPQWVSDVAIDSYHTVWFELHEDLLRLLGRRRQEQR